MARPRRADAPERGASNTLCPACGSSLAAAGPRFTARWQGRVVRLLSARCKRLFKCRRDGEGLTWEPPTFD